MRLPFGLKWLCGHRWRQTSTPKRYPSWIQNEWVCLDCGKRTLRLNGDPPIILLHPWETQPGLPDPYEEVLPL